MKRVVMTIGPQFAGKTTFCRKFVELFPGTKLVCLDEIRLQLAGSIYLSEDSPYEFQAKLEMGLRVEQHLCTSNELLIMDAFIPSVPDLIRIAGAISRKGEVHAWHFVTPFETCIAWSGLRKTDQHLPLSTRVARIRQQDAYMKAEAHLWSRAFRSVDRIDARDPVSVEVLRRQLSVLRSS